MTPEYVHLNPITLFYLFMIYLQTLPLHMVDTQQIEKHVHGSRSQSEQQFRHGSEQTCRN